MFTRENAWDIYLEMALDISLEIASKIPSDAFGVLSVCSMLYPRREMWCLCLNKH